MSSQLATSSPGRETEASPERVLAELSRVGKGFKRIVVTENQRVMASVTDRGRTLRIQKVFLQAPAEVLHALGTVLTRPKGREVGAEREALRTFLAGVATGSTQEPPRRRARRFRPPSPEDLPYLRRLEVEFRSVNAAHFDSNLPEIPIRLSTRMSRRNGHFSAAPPTIVISRTLFTSAMDGEAERTLRHEMIHLWQWATGSPLGHGAEFRRLAGRLQIHPRATRAVCWLPKE